MSEEVKPANEQIPLGKLIQSFAYEITFLHNKLAALEVWIQQTSGMSGDFKKFMDEAEVRFKEKNKDPRKESHNESIQ